MRKTILLLGVMLILFGTTAIAQTKSITIPATAFKVMNPNGGGYYTGERYAYPLSGATYRHWAAPIILPDNAKVVKVTLFYYDSAGGNITFRIQRTNLYNNSYTRPFEVVSDAAGSTSVPATKSASGYMKVNMSGYEHVAWIYFGTDSGVRIWGVKIIYNE